MSSRPVQRSVGTPLTEAAALVPPPRPGIRPSARYFPEIDALRGLALLLIVAHDTVTAFRGGEGRVVAPWAGFVWSGHTGVALLFVLSGFLLSLEFFQEAKGGPHVSVQNFYLRRALRLLPPYYLAVVVASVLTAHDALDLLRGVPFLFFLNTLAGTTQPLLPYSAVWWSLATEVPFILLVPLVTIFLRWRVSRRIAWGIIYVYAISMAAFLLSRLQMHSIEGQLTLASSFFGRGYQFGFGMAVAWMYVHYADRARAWLAHSPLVRRGGADAVLILLFGALALLLRWVARYGAMRMEAGTNHAWHGPEGLLWAGILLLLLLAPLRTRRLLVNRALIPLGLIAYSLYLTHVPLIFWARIYWPRGAGLATNLLMSAGLVAAFLAVSTLLYWMIERPFLIRKARIPAQADADQTT